MLKHCSAASKEIYGRLCVISVTTVEMSGSISRRNSKELRFAIVLVMCLTYYVLKHNRASNENKKPTGLGGGVETYAVF